MPRDHRRDDKPTFGRSGACNELATTRMIPKSGYRFSEEIMLG
jgi:hypothetical protein